MLLKITGAKINKKKVKKRPNRYIVKGILLYKRGLKWLLRVQKLKTRGLCLVVRNVECFSSYKYWATGSNGNRILRKKRGRIWLS